MVFLDFLFCLNSVSRVLRGSLSPVLHQTQAIIGLLMLVSHISGIIVSHISYALSRFFSCFREESKSGPYYSILVGRRNTVLFCFIYISLRTHDFYIFCLYIAIHCNHFPFCCSKYDNFSQWQPPHVGFCVFLFLPVPLMQMIFRHYCIDIWGNYIFAFAKLVFKK